MTYQEEGQVRLRRQRTKHAITLAMQGQWREAIAANQEIIASFPNDVDAFNRLGKAFMKLGEYTQAEEAYRKAGELDPYNTIAKKNLHRLALLSQSRNNAEVEVPKVEPRLFIEETGKAGAVSLHNLAPQEVLAHVTAGDKVFLKVEGNRLLVSDGQGDYLGRVEPRHERRLVKLIEGGNQYEAAAVSVREDRVKVIIREVYQHPSQVGQPSFPPRPSEGPRPDISDRIIRRELEEEEPLFEEYTETTDRGLDEE